MRDTTVWAAAATLLALLLIGLILVGEPDLNAAPNTLPPGEVQPVTDATTALSTTTPHSVVAPQVASVTTPARRSKPFQLTEPEPPPPPPAPTPGIVGSTAADRCTQYETMLAELAPAGGWDVTRMSRYMRRESGCCPNARGGDVLTRDCRVTGVDTWSHRSDVGLLQINGVNYDPARCGRHCTVHDTLEELKDPTVNIRAAATLCAWWRNAGSSCYRPWRGTG